MTSGRNAPVRRVRTGAVPTFVAIVLAGGLVVLLGVSPTLNPLNLLIGRAFDVVVPAVAGLPESKALAVLDGKRLVGAVRFEHSNTVERGRVVSSSPAERDTVRSGSKVVVTVSRGPTQVKVPDFTTMNEITASGEVERLGLVPRLERVNDEDAAKGMVFRQSPAPGEVVGGSSVVKLTASLGPAPRGVPDVAKLAIEGALFTLGRAGFTLGAITTQDDPTLPANAVIRTEPAAGEIRDRDTPVNVVVSNGPAPVTVPFVIKNTYDQAVASIAAAGLIPALKVVVVPAGDPEIGTVVDQSPAGGAGLRPGQVVTLTVKQPG